MKKVTLNFWLDVLLFLTFLGIAFTGSILKWVLPSRCGEGGGWRGGWGDAERLEEECSRWFLGVHRSQWLDIHFLLAVILVALVLVHFILHWNWILCSIKTNLFRRVPQSRIETSPKDCR